MERREERGEESYICSYYYYILSLYLSILMQYRPCLCYLLVGSSFLAVAVCSSNMNTARLSETLTQGKEGQHDIITYM